MVAAELACRAHYALVNILFSKAPSSIQVSRFLWLSTTLLGCDDTFTNCGDRMPIARSTMLATQDARRVCDKKNVLRYFRLQAFASRFVRHWSNPINCGDELRLPIIHLLKYISDCANHRAKLLRGVPICQSNANFCDCMRTDFLSSDHRRHHHALYIKSYVFQMQFRTRPLIW